MNKLGCRIFSCLKLTFIFAAIVCGVSSCVDRDPHLGKPDWLGASIYEELQRQGTFTTYVRLIDDLQYREVLSKTGSKTLFVADDAAFERFYANNPWGIHSYGEMSEAQKKIILNSSMLNNAMLLENLASVAGPVEGQAFRRATALAVMDSISWESPANLPANVYWDRFRTTGLMLAKDATATPLLLLLEAQKTAKNITDDDFSVVLGKPWNQDDAYLFNIKVRKGDIVCQNGYIHVLEEVLVPKSNMAEVIRTTPATTMFSSFLERWAAPYYSGALTDQWRLLGGTDSVFVKRYMSERGEVNMYNATSRTVTTPDGKTTSSFLAYDPGWNRYEASQIDRNFQTDMGVIFAPTDAALNEYFNNGGGKTLKERYGSVEAIPDNVLEKLVRNHMKPSFMGALPSLFHTIVDDAQEKIGITKSDIVATYLSCNGVVYVTNKVYAPSLYKSVMLPATINENMKVFKWAIDQTNFDAYLLSMVSYYSFLLPTDNFTYIVPSSLKKASPEAWKFRFDKAKNMVYASVHPYNKLTGEIGDSVSAQTTTDVLKRHLEDMLDYHIIVGNIEDGKEFYRTKGGGTVRVAGSGLGMKVSGGGDIERNTQVVVNNIYDYTQQNGNGKTYITEQPIQTPTQSVYSILSDSTKSGDFGEFFQLMQGADELFDNTADKGAGNDVRYSIFYQDKSNAGLDFNVRSLNTFHYTIYVPTNAAVLEAYRTGLPSWDDVERVVNQGLLEWNGLTAETTTDLRNLLAEKIIRFVRYHIQDNSVYLDNNASIAASYETATLNKASDTFYKLTLEGGGGSLTLTTAKGEKAHVDTSKGLYNIMARDFKFNTANPLTATYILTSSYVVIHQIDKCLYFE